MKDKERLEQLMGEVNTPKERLMDIAFKLEEEGYIRKANTLMGLVRLIEEWQHK